MLDSTRGAAMFLRRYSRTKDGKPHTYYALVESVRTDAGPRQRVVAYLGELNHDQERRWQRTVVFYNRQGEAQELCLFPDDETPIPDDANVARVRLDKVGWCNWTRSLRAMCRTTWRPSLPPTSSPSRSSIACASRAASSPWPSVGTPRPAWRTF